MSPTSDDQKVSGPVILQYRTVQKQYSAVLTSDVENVPVLPRLVRVLRVGRPAGEVEPGVLPAGAVPVNSTVQYSSVQYSTVQYSRGCAYN